MGRPAHFSARVAAAPGQGYGRLRRARLRHRPRARHLPEDAAQALPRRARHRHIAANAKVAESLFRKAIGDGRQSVTAAIFWLKTRAGWKETSVHELGGTEVGPVVVKFIGVNRDL